MYSARTLVTSADARRPPGIVDFAASHDQEVFVSDRNARLTVHGRRLLVHRVLELGMPVAHVARAMGVSCSALIAGFADSSSREMPA